MPRVRCPTALAGLDSATASSHFVRPRKNRTCRVRRRLQSRASRLAAFPESRDIVGRKFWWRGIRGALPIAGRLWPSAYSQRYPLPEPAWILYPTKAADRVVGPYAPLSVAFAPQTASPRPALTADKARRM